jgi:hypothetical protein
MSVTDDVKQAAQAFLAPEMSAIKRGLYIKIIC